MHRILKLCCIVSIIVSGIWLSGCEKSKETGFQEVSLEEKETFSDEEESTKIFVHICGEVKNPGVYELDAGSRIFEAVDAAGGMTKAAAGDAVNQAEVLTDGQQIYLPSMEEIQKQMQETAVTDSGKVNINKASKEELMTLPGIGESKADAIVRYRQEKGNFGSIDEIMEIEGIKEGVFRKIENQITVS